MFEIQIGMKKSAKFLIAENPMVDDDRVFVVHTQEPFFIAEAFHFMPDQEQDWMDPFSLFHLPSIHFINLAEDVVLNIVLSQIDVRSLWKHGLVDYLESAGYSGYLIW